METLGTLETDGTHDQLKPFFGMSGKDQYYCFDRSFASDLATHTLKSLPKDKYIYSKKKGKFVNPNPNYKMVWFSVGQPLGLLSSWPLFALSHHVLVWTAAERARGTLS